MVESSYPQEGVPAEAALRALVSENRQLQEELLKASVRRLRAPVEVGMLADFCSSSQGAASFFSFRGDALIYFLLSGSFWE